MVLEPNGETVRFSLSRTSSHNSSHSVGFHRYLSHHVQKSPLCIFKKRETMMLATTDLYRIRYI
jgi:hypothetical protein